MFPEISTATDRFFCHLGPFFALLPPPNSSKNENIKKTRKTGNKKWRKHLEISSFYAHVPKIMIICSTVPEIYVCDKCNCYFFFWAIFCPFTSLTAQKMKISKKWKKTQEISSFYTTVSKIMIIGYTAPEIWHVTHAILIFHFGLFFAFLPPWPKNQNFKKMKKLPGDITILRICHKNYD